MPPNRHVQAQKKYPVGIPLVILLVVGFAWWVLATTHSLNLQYDIIQRQLTENQEPLFQTILFENGSTPIVLPLKDPFRSNGRWVYASDSHLLPKNYSPEGLVDLTVPHTASRTTFSLRLDAAKKLQELFNAATKANTPLIVASAYRSIPEQTELYDYRVAIIGKDATRNSTSLPGASEHHTGLAVDINSYTQECQADATSCGLSPDSADWLKDQAPKYGFIIRYPDGKLTQTGIGYEPWHLRYIGKEALALTESGLTLDEFYKKVTVKR